MDSSTEKGGSLSTRDNRQGLRRLQFWVTQTVYTRLVHEANEMKMPLSAYLSYLFAQRKVVEEKQIKVPTNKNAEELQRIMKEMDETGLLKMMKSKRK
jgi:phosphoglycerate-specific signal transduction histidine kinase